MRKKRRGGKRTRGEKPRKPSSSIISKRIKDRRRRGEKR